MVHKSKPSRIKVHLALERHLVLSFKSWLNEADSSSYFKETMSKLNWYKKRALIGQKTIVYLPVYPLKTKSSSFPIE